MKQKIYQVDAFADSLFSGNPAAVCPLKKWLSDDLMQKIAMENNLSETAFYVEKRGRYELRWFTPTLEVDLCGHATLAAAFVLFNHEGHEGDTIEFHSPRSGKLTVSREGHLHTLNFPADEPIPFEILPEISACFGRRPDEVFTGKTDLMLVFEKEAEIAAIVPDLNAILKMNYRGVIATAKGETVDFVSRFFAPRAGVPEDPVTGTILGKSIG